VRSAPGTAHLAHRKSPGAHRKPRHRRIRDPTLYRTPMKSSTATMTALVTRPARLFLDTNHLINISTLDWSGFGQNGIDAALYSGSKCFIFSGNQYIRVTRENDDPGKIDEGYPKNISTWRWGSFGMNRIDDALNSGDILATSSQHAPDNRVAKFPITASESVDGCTASATVFPERIIEISMEGRHSGNTGSTRYSCVVVVSGYRGGNRYVILDRPETETLTVGANF